MCEDAIALPLATAARAADRQKGGNLIVQQQRLAVGLFVAGILACCAAPAIGGQSLADAARRAGEDRQSRPDALSFTDRDLTAPSAGNRDALALELTMPLLQRYAGVRTTILRAMVQSPDIAAQVQGTIPRAGARGVEGLEGEYTNIPTVVDALRAGQMTVHDYVVTEVAFMAAVGVLAGRLPVSGRPAGTIATSMEFLRRHQPDIAALFQEALTLEERLARQMVAPGATPR
jgi:hypothetical protein